MQHSKAKLYKLLIVIVLIGHCALFAKVVDKGVQFGDPLAFLAQASAVIDGDIERYVNDNSFIVENSFRILGPIAYNWGMPLVLSGVQHFFGLNITAMKFANCILFIIALAMFGGWVRERLGFVGVGLVIWLATHPVLFIYENWLLADHAFLSVSIICLLGFRKLASIWRKNQISCDKFVAITSILALAPITFRLNGVVVTIAIAMSVICMILQDLHYDRSLLRSRLLLLLKLSSISLALIVIWRSQFPFGGLLPLQRSSPLVPFKIMDGLMYYATASKDF